MQISPSSHSMGVPEQPVGPQLSSLVHGFLSSHSITVGDKPTVQTPSTQRARRHGSEFSRSAKTHSSSDLHPPSGVGSAISGSGEFVSVVSEGEVSADVSAVSETESSLCASLLAEQPVITMSPARKSAGNSVRLSQG